MKSYLIHLGDALSQFFNVLLLNGHPNESLSGRAWRTQSVWYKVIDFIFWFDPEHCRMAYANDVLYAEGLLKQ